MLFKFNQEIVIGEGKNDVLKVLKGEIKYKQAGVHHKSQLEDLLTANISM